jgi:hypothetical protein
MELGTGITAVDRRTVKVHESQRGRKYRRASRDDDLYVMQRTGHTGRERLVLVMNNRRRLSGAAVEPMAKYAIRSGAWRGLADAGIPEEKGTDSDGWRIFDAAARLCGHSLGLMHEADGTATSTAAGPLALPLARKLSFICHPGVAC